MMARMKNATLLVVVLIASLVWALPVPDAVAAEPVTMNVASLDESQFPDLAAVVDVLDANGRPIANLSRGNFQVNVGGQAAEIADLRTAVDADVSLAVVLAVDVSGSMAGEPLLQARKAAVEFVSGLSPQDTVAVLTFGDTVALAQDFTSDKNAAILSIEGLQAVGNTALYQAASEASFKAASSPVSRKVIILLSDGIDWGGKSTVPRDDSIAQARFIGVPVYTVGLGSEIDRDYLSGLSQATGARLLETPTAEGLSQLYAEIGGLLRGQYVLKLTSPVTDRSQALSLSLSVTIGGNTATTTETLPALIVSETPRVSLAGLSEGQKVDSVITLGADVTGDNPVSVVRFLVDDETVSEDTTPPFQLSLDPSLFARGGHTLRVEVEDSTGTVGQTEMPFEVVATSVAAGGGGGVPLMPLLLAVLMAALGGAGGYLFWRWRRARSPRRSAEVRLRPWFNPKSNRPAPKLEDWLEVAPSVDLPPQAVLEPRGKLTIVGGPGAGTEYAVGSRPITIGCGGWCTMVLPEDEDRMGAEEARAWVHQSNRLIFHKLTRLSVIASEGSAGGWVVLQDGDEISVGPCRLAFHLVTPQSQEEESVSSAIDEALRGLSPQLNNETAGEDVALPLPQPVDDGSQERFWEQSDEERTEAAG